MIVKKIIVVIGLNGNRFMNNTIIYSPKQNMYISWKLESKLPT